MKNDVGNYFDIDTFAKLLPNIKNTLFNMENQDLLKLLYYDGSEVFTKDDISIRVLAGMLNEGNKETCKVYGVRYTGETLIEGKSQIRLFLDGIRPYSNSQKLLGQFKLEVQIVSHNNNRLIRGKDLNSSVLYNRQDYLLASIIKSLNGADIDGIGRIYMETGDFATNVPFKENFTGYRLSFTSKV